MSFDFKYIVLTKVFPHEWCNNMITLMDRETNGAEAMEIGKDRYLRYDFLNKELAKEIHDYLQQHIDVSKFKVSHRFYMNKYWPESSYIGLHSDGHITDSRGCKSVYTILIYLNKCKGGTTKIMGNHQVHPDIGRVLLLDQNTMHEGVPPTEGTFKYILRSDLMTVQ